MTGVMPGIKLSLQYCIFLVRYDILGKWNMQE